MIEKIRKQILNDTGVLVIPSNTTSNKPDTPFATINITSPWIDDVGHADVFRYVDDDGAHMQRSEMYQFVMSLNVYAKGDVQAIQLANKIRTWFVMQGEHLLEDMNVVVVSRSNIENRTTFLVDSYEYKHGFDVQVRATQSDNFTNYEQDGEEATYDWIEKVEIEFKGVE